MIDLERLDKALAYEDGELIDLPGDTQQIITAAARAYRDLLANGEEVEWCLEHEAQFNGLAHPPRCRYWIQTVMYEGSGAVIADCRIVSKLLINPPTGEEE